MNKKYLVGGGAVVGSLVLFYGAASFFSCGMSDSCRANPDFIGGKVVKAIEINFQTNTTDGWSGKENPSLTVTSPGAEIKLPPPPPPRLGH